MEAHGLLDNTFLDWTYKANKPQVTSIIHPLCSWAASVSQRVHPCSENPKLYTPQEESQFLPPAKGAPCAGKIPSAPTEGAGPGLLGLEKESYAQNPIAHGSLRPLLTWSTTLCGCDPNRWARCEIFLAVHCSIVMVLDMHAYVYIIQMSITRVLISICFCIYICAYGSSRANRHNQNT